MYMDAPCFSSVGEIPALEHQHCRVAALSFDRTHDQAFIFEAQAHTSYVRVYVLARPVHANSFMEKLSCNKKYVAQKKNNNTSYMK
jgi:hypothetical protein